MDNRFPPSFRLRRTSEFQKVFAAKCSAADGAVILFAAPNELPHCRLGLSVSKRVGNAVVRNRWKRLLREAFRKSQSELPGGLDLVAVPQRNVEVRSVKNLEQSLTRLTAKMVKRSKGKESISPHVFPCASSYPPPPLCSNSNRGNTKNGNTKNGDTKNGNTKNIEATRRKKAEPPTVLLTRAEHQAEPVKTRLESLGFRVLLQPAIDILPPESWQETDDAFQQLRQNEFDWLLFSSSNGVQMFFDRVKHCLSHSPPPSRCSLCESFSDFAMQFHCKGLHCKEHRKYTKKKNEHCSHIQIAVVGSSTDAVLHQRIGRHADMVPEFFTAESMAEALLPEATQGKRFLHLRASRGREVLRRMLTESGGNVTEIAVYQSADRTDADPHIAELLRQGKIGCTTVTSSAIARSLVNLFGDLLRQTSLVSISPITTQTLCDLGFPPQQEAGEASLTGIVNTLLRVMDTA